VSTAKAKLKHIYWFTFYDLHSPTVRYRGKYVCDHFNEHFGITSSFVIPGRDFSAIFRFFKAWFSALLLPRRGSLIVIQSVYSRSFYANALKLLVKIRSRNVFYDLDDADYLRYSPETIYFFLENCTAVTLGSSELVKNLSKYNSNTFLVTCPVPDLNIVKQKKNAVLTIGWIGDFTKGHKESLMNTFFPALKELPFRVRLVMMGANRKEEHASLLNYLSQFDHVTLDIPKDIDWFNEKAIQEKISGFDIGIATLLDNEFYRSKSAFKLKQCLNSGVPVLSSDLPENNAFLEDGKNGYFCDTAGDFRERIMEFNSMDERTYAEFSGRARSSVHRYDLKNYCREIIAAYANKVN
jgi:glycosyltransferase involved in cell wall biosynthesis